MLIRLAEYDDVPAILAINNHFVLHSWANFAVEPDPLEAWQREYDETHAMFPWYVAVEEDQEEKDPHPRPLCHPQTGERGDAENPLPLGEGGERSEPGEGESCGRRGEGGNASEEEEPSPPAPLPGGEGSIVGFAKASPWHGRCAYAYTAEITVYIKPECHRRGIGKALYERLLPTLTAQGYHTVIGAIAQPNQASVRLHESFGLVHSGTFPRVGRKFEKWHDVGYWVKQLQPPDAKASRIKPVREVVE